jgi:hypothetical protein
MKAAAPIVLALSLTGCAGPSTSDFVQGSIRIVPPVEQTRPGAVAHDGGTVSYAIKDAKGATFGIYIDHRLDTKTPGAIYLLAYPGDRGSIRVKNEMEFRQKVRFE